MIKTKIVQINRDNPDEYSLKEVVKGLRVGKLIAFPTETVYGIGTNAYNKDSIGRIFQIKKRPTFDPIIVHILNNYQLEKVASNIPEEAWKLAERFWPGPLTLVLKRHPDIPANVSANLNTIAVRIPKHNIASLLLELSKVPIAAPSANLFARPSSTTAKHVLDDLNGLIDYVIDGGSCQIGIESTVVDLTKEKPVILRPGGINFDDLKKVLPLISVGPKYIINNDGKDISSSPGMLLKHYSPKANLYIVRSNLLESIIKFIKADALKNIENGKKIGIMISNNEIKYFKDFNAETVTLGSETNLNEIAHNLFECIRKLDSLGVDIIYTKIFSKRGLGLAVWDRMFRASEGKVIDV